MNHEHRGSAGFRRYCAAVIAVILAVTLGACSAQVTHSVIGEAVSNAVSGIPGIANTSGLQVHAVPSIKAVIVRRIAIMPLVSARPQAGQTLEEGAAQSVTGILYARAVLVGGWDVVPEGAVDQALQTMPPMTVADMNRNAVALARKLNVDGVIYGIVREYRERVGYSYSAQTPAKVGFTLYYLDQKSGEVVWTANFAKEQKSLSQNVFDLPNFIESGARWVRASDIATSGVREALDNLQSSVTVEPIVQGR